MMHTLRSKVIRLAHSNPELRPHLLPLLHNAAEKRVRVINEDGKEVSVSPQTLRDPTQRSKYKPIKKKTEGEKSKSPHLDKKILDSADASKLAINPKASASLAGEKSLKAIKQMSPGAKAKLSESVSKAKLDVVDEIEGTVDELFAGPLKRFKGNEKSIKEYLTGKSQSAANNFKDIFKTKGFEQDGSFLEEARTKIMNLNKVEGALK